MRVTWVTRIGHATLAICPWIRGMVTYHRGMRTYHRGMRTYHRVPLKSTRQPPLSHPAGSAGASGGRAGAAPATPRGRPPSPAADTRPCLAPAPLSLSLSLSHTHARARARANTHARTASGGTASSCRRVQSPSDPKDHAHTRARTHAHTRHTCHASCIRHESPLESAALSARPSAWLSQPTLDAAETRHKAGLVTGSTPSHRVNPNHRIKPRHKAPPVHPISRAEPRLSASRNGPPMSGTELTYRRRCTPPPPHAPRVSAVRERRIADAAWLRRTADANACVCGYVTSPPWPRPAARPSASLACAAHNGPQPSDAPLTPDRPPVTREERLMT